MHGPADGDRDCDLVPAAVEKILILDRADVTAEGLRQATADHNNYQGEYLQLNYDELNNQLGQLQVPGPNPRRVLLENEFFFRG